LLESLGELPLHVDHAAGDVRGLASPAGHQTPARVVGAGIDPHDTDVGGAHVTALAGRIRLWGKRLIAQTPDPGPGGRVVGGEVELEASVHLFLALLGRREET